MRIELIVEYLGYAYAGYQRQNNGYTIQQALEEAYFSLTGEQVNMTAAGRTDAGVSALAQHVHFDTNATIPPDKISYAMNTRLQDDIRIQLSRQHEGFHARYDARGKHYRYTICNKAHASAILAHTSWHVPYALDFAAMRQAASAMVGEHDFRAFMAAGAQVKTTVRTVFGLELTQQDGFIMLDVSGNGFLYNMVRIMTGTLVDVGKGKLDAQAIGGIIKAGNRALAGQTAPPQGLLLVEVFY